ncbi:MAG: Flp pilus assembly protein CpaB [Proteobacteria bacterium]|nr:Flp pilus assembly protein CpaB [Pseudomonadota bacterium]MBU1449469.1 Flp pilus assembly protein CpaB [Pseudomonadota bacterium]MBU2468781.1 Flp pilus assembly protein CpaB [Pseudomonadota bacterium]MBU2516574.1 Flp pilus assembly protein CpaB [Pseudomonadota bacterium]
MSRKGPLIFLILALVLAGAAAWGAHQWLRVQSAGEGAKKLNLAPVVVASRVLPAGQQLTAKDLAVQAWPVSALPPGRFGQSKQVMGRVLKGPMVKGEVVLAGKLAPEGAAGGLSAVVPPGSRAMTVKVDEVIGVGGFVQPGDRVDVLVTLAGGSFRNDPVSRTVLEDINVLTVGEKIQRDDQGRGRTNKVKVVTLQLKPGQAERLALASNEGRVVLALRNQTDREPSQGGGVSLSALVPLSIPKLSAQAAEPQKPQGTVVEVLKGVKLSRQIL